jgi:hypothetical protein
LSYVESNEVPTGQVIGLIQFEDWKDTDMASMPAPSTATALELGAKERDNASHDNSDVSQEESDSDIDDSEFRRLSKNITKMAQDKAEKEGRVEPLLENKPSKIVWERSTVITGYHRFDDV